MNLEKEKRLSTPVSFEETASIPDSIVSFNSHSSRKNPGRIINAFHRFNSFLDALGVESRGLERAESYERYSTFYSPNCSLSTWQKLSPYIRIISLWFSACGGLTSMSGYLLGPLVFQLNLKDCLVSGLLGSAVGCAVAGYCSTMGPRSGLRQFVSARFAFGFYPVKVLTVLSLIGLFGWSLINCVFGGQILLALSDGKVPLQVGILIVALVGLFVGVFGIKSVLKYEGALAIPTILGGILLYAAASGTYRGTTDAVDYTELGINSPTVVGNWLSFFTLAYGVTATWGSITSDYVMFFPEETPGSVIGMVTGCTIFISTAIIATVGILISNAAFSSEMYMNFYNTYGSGGLLVAAFSSWGGFGKFCVVVLFLSLISNNVLNTYSIAFNLLVAVSSNIEAEEVETKEKKMRSIKSIAVATLRFIENIPRYMWSFAITMVYFVLALVGRNSLADFMDNFLPMLGYWISFYFVVLLEENCIFRNPRFNFFPVYSEAGRRRELYNWSAWNQKRELCYGIAAAVSFCCGVAGAVLGMSQHYFIGPVAKQIGDFGGDVGVFLGFAFAGVVYPGVRYWEIKRFGR